MLGWVSLITIWILTLMNYSNLPETIPTHYNGAGEVDGFGAKSNILALPIVASIIFLGLKIISKYPHIYNYPTTIRTKKPSEQYTNATKLLRYLNFIIVLIFGLIVLRTIQYSNGNADGLGVWFLPLTMGLIFVPVIYFVKKSIKTAK
ncbi:MAG: DUF1648 domain-containing protein [Eudoraea sp.]